jgi:hypothetical protein
VTTKTLAAFVSIQRGIRHVSRHTAAPLETALQDAGVPRAAGVSSPALKRLLRYASYAGLVRNLSQRSRWVYLVPLMSLQEAFVVPYCYLHEIIPLIWDCFTPEYHLWDAFFYRHRVRVALFTARESCAYFASRRSGMKCEWIPEATDPSEFDPVKPLSERRIDVLEFGRKYDLYHKAIAPDLAAAGRCHLYERVKGEVVFPSRADFVGGLADAKISVCFPCNMTHPERSGTVETATHRYFESMASGCLLVGRAPRELTDVLGFNPVVEVVPQQASEQLREILENVANYQGQVTRNLEAVRRLGTWQARVPLILNALREQGYCTVGSATTLLQPS